MLVSWAGILDKAPYKYLDSSLPNIFKLKVEVEGNGFSLIVR